MWLGKEHHKGALLEWSVDLSAWSCHWIARWGPETGGARAAGVCWHSQNKKWAAQITADTGDGESKHRHLGSFVKEVDAALAYDQAAREYHKDKAKLNFPDLPPPASGGLEHDHTSGQLPVPR
jgi:hypothetical protein